MRSIKHWIFVYGIWLNGFLANILSTPFSPFPPPSLPFTFLSFLAIFLLGPTAAVAATKYAMPELWLATQTIQFQLLCGPLEQVQQQQHAPHTHTHTHTYGCTGAHVCVCGHPELTVLYIRQALQFASYSSPLSPRAVSFLCRLVAG